LANGFAPMFDGPLDGIGVVSILDMLVEWLERAKLCTIHARNGNTYLGFEIPKAGCKIYTIKQNNEQIPLVQLKTKSGDSLWLLQKNFSQVVKEFDWENRSKSEQLLGLVHIAGLAMELPRKSLSGISAIKIPEIDFDIKPDIGFMRGVNTHDKKGQSWFVSVARQQFKFHMNREGARAKVAVSIGITRGLTLDKSKPLIFKEPFIGWFTQADVPKIPLAIFAPDYDSWKKSST